MNTKSSHERVKMVPKRLDRSETLDEQKAEVARLMERALRRGGNPYDVYVEYLVRETDRIAGQRGRLGPDAFDISQKVLEKFIRHSQRYLILYPNPVDFVRASWKRMAIDHRRNESAQRGEGSTLQPNGRSPRQVIQIKHADGRALEVSGPVFDPEEQFLSREGVAEILEMLDDIDATIFEMAYIEECSDAHIADYVGLTRETVNRRKNAALKFLRERLQRSTA